MSFLVRDELSVLILKRKFDLFSLNRSVFRAKLDNNRIRTLAVSVIIIVPGLGYAYLIVEESYLCVILSYKGVIHCSVISLVVVIATHISIVICLCTVSESALDPFPVLFINIFVFVSLFFRRCLHVDDKGG